MYKYALGILLALYVTAVFAAEATRDGRSFDSLSTSDVTALSADEQAAYQVWQEMQSIEQTSTYQQSEGPNTMDLSSDFSM